MASKDRRDRILDVAIELAEEGGFENVRQRDVAAKAGVALGTLYKSFRSKEDILSAALERDTQALERRLEKKSIPGDDALERATQFFQMLTRRLCRKPHYARAVIRAVASGEPEVAGNVVAYWGRMTRLVIATLGGKTAAEVVEPSERETTLAMHLQQFWFASLVGWSAGLHTSQAVVDQTRRAAELLLLGLEAEGQAGPMEQAEQRSQ